MTRRSVSKIQVLDARHPGLREKMEQMFEESWPASEVKQMLQTNYGEHLSLRSIDRCKRQAIGASGHRSIGSSGHCESGIMNSEL